MGQLTQVMALEKLQNSRKYMPSLVASVLRLTNIVGANVPLAPCHRC